MSVVTLIPQSRPLTAADLESMPDDGHRYELIDATLIVTPSPAVPHQRVVGNLHVLLRADVSEHLEVMLAPLAVEVLSPSTRLIDLNLKKAAFERAGVESYRVIDPERPAITVWQLRDGTNAEVAAVEGDEILRVDAPFPLELAASDLVR